MAIQKHPKKGTLLMCDFNHGFKSPEMVKKRPVIVLSPKIQNRPHLCTVVALSTSEPQKIMPYHGQIDINPPLPERFTSKGLWIKGDMINTVGFHRLNFIRIGKNHDTGKRIYYYNTISVEQLKFVQACVLSAIGLKNLKIYL